MTTSTPDLGTLFGAALGALRSNRQQVNDLDGYNGNHGDNMVHNLDVITQALRSQAEAPPAAALETAAQQLQTQGKGGTSRYYAQGLNQAADQFRGQSELSNDDVMKLLQSVLGSIPAAGSAPAASPASAPAQAGAGNVLEALLGMAGGSPQQSQAAQPPSGGDLLGGLLGAMGGQAQPSAAQPDGLGLDDLMTAAAHFMRAKQAGSDNMTAVTQAAMGALMGSQPLQSNSPQAAAGGLIAQSVLGALFGRK